MFSRNIILNKIDLMECNMVTDFSDHDLGSPFLFVCIVGSIWAVFLLFPSAILCQCLCPEADIFSLVKAAYDCLLFR